MPGTLERRCPPPLPLDERALELVHDGLEQVTEHGPAAGLHEHFGRHAGTELQSGQPAAFLTAIYVALDEALSVPFAGSAGPAAGGTPQYDSRTYTRVSKFPSGELPRGVTTVAVGGAYDNGAGVPAATVDEVVFGDSTFASNEDTHGAQLVLLEDVGEDEDVLHVEPAVIRAFEAGPDGLDLICIGGRRPPGNDAERFPGFWVGDADPGD